MFVTYNLTSFFCKNNGLGVKLRNKYNVNF